jgi:hypothetical protein
LRNAQVDYETAVARIRVLRDAVEAGYREQQLEVDRVIKAREAALAEEEQIKREKRRHRGTNITCSVCAIRSFHLHHNEEDNGTIGEVSSCLGGCILHPLLTLLVTTNANQNDENANVRPFFPFISNFIHILQYTRNSLKPCMVMLC